MFNYYCVSQGILLKYKLITIYLTVDNLYIYILDVMMLLNFFLVLGGDLFNPGCSGGNIMNTFIYCIYYAQQLLIMHSSILVCNMHFYLYRHNHIDIYSLLVMSF